MGEFADMAAKALPCPFCGERLVVKDDHHGEWVAHRDEAGPCICNVVQIFDRDDLAEWNTRDAGAALSDEQLRERLFDIGKPSLTEWCRVHDVNRNHANEFAIGVRGPGSDLLRAMGVERAWRPVPQGVGQRGERG